MWTLSKLVQIDESVRKRYSGEKVLTEEKVGLSLKEPEMEPSAYVHVRKLAYEISGMHYTSPQYNLILLQDEINRRVGRDLVKDTPTYSAPHRKIHFYLDDGSRATFDPTKPIDKHVFLARFGLA